MDQSGFTLQCPLSPSLSLSQSLGADGSELSVCSVLSVAETGLDGHTGDSKHINYTNKFSDN